MVIGEGYFRPRLEDMAERLRISQNTLFVGFQTYELLPHYIGASDICLAPYTSAYGPEDTLSPLKLYAYMASARPVVISDVPVEVDPVDLERAAVVVPADSAEGLAEGILKLLNDSALAESMGESGRKIAMEYTWDRFADDVLQMLPSVQVASMVKPNDG